MRDLLDLDAAFLTDHQGDALRRSIDNETQIQLSIDREPFLHEQARHLLAIRAGLIGHQRLAEDFTRELFRFFGRLRDLDATGLAAAAGMDLRLDYGHAGAKPLGNVCCFLCGDRHFTTGDRNAELGERSEEHTSELQSQSNLVCRLLLEKKKKI